MNRVRSAKCRPRTWLLLLSLLHLVPAAAATKPVVFVPQVVPVSKRTQVLVASADLPGRNYVVFAVLLRLSDSALFVGYKRMGIPMRRIARRISNCCTSTR
jgi:hypothetical protein